MAPFFLSEACFLQLPGIIAGVAGTNCKSCTRIVLKSQDWGGVEGQERYQ
jgi:hypothetical protein